jgi:Holliday junction resolvase RusA-like endonuclease
MNTITFQVTGEPKAQPRPRAFAMKMGDGKYSARVFDAGTAEGWKSQIAIAAKPHQPEQPLLGPVLVNATFVFARPNLHYRSNNPAKPLRDDAPHWHTKKPDRDNLDKALLDALTQLGGFWRDDTQVCAGEIRKVFGSSPGALVEIKALDAVVGNQAGGVAA